MWQMKASHKVSRIQFPQGRKLQVGSGHERGFPQVPSVDAHRTTGQPFPSL